MKAATAMWWLFVLGSCIGHWGCGREAAEVSAWKAIRTVPDEGPPRDPELWWREIREAKAPIEYDKYEDPAVYWVATLKASHTALWRHLVSASEDDLRYLVGRFGVSGSQADFRLMFCDPYLTLDQGEFTAWPLTKEKDGISSDAFSVLRGKIARFQTEHFWNNGVALQRYCHALIWRGVIRPGYEYDLPIFAAHVAKGIASNDEAEFWYHARNVLMCLAVTDRLDLIHGVTPTELRNAFAK